MSDDMMEVLELFESFEAKLSKTIFSLKTELAALKAGRANPHLLDKIVVDYYGTPTPINQLGNIAVPEARLLVISVWDTKALKDVEKAIIAANVGITPNNDGKVLRLVFPELTEERRKSIVKDIRNMAENTKVALRNSRRDINDVIKKFKKDSVITEDDCSIYEKDIDKKTAEAIDEVDAILKVKEAEVLNI